MLGEMLGHHTSSGIIPSPTLPNNIGSLISCPDFSVNVMETERNRPGHLHNQAITSSLFTLEFALNSKDVISTLCKAGTVSPRRKKEKENKIRITFLRRFILITRIYLTTSPRPVK